MNPTKTCYKCGKDNQFQQSFCGGCGSPLRLEDFISETVTTAVAEAVRGRDVLETESAIKVFERAWGWVKIVGAIAAILLAIVGGGVFWKISDWWKAVDNAKQSVASDATTTKQQITTTEARAVSDIQNASKSASEANRIAAQTAAHLSGDLQNTATRTKSELASEALAVKGEVANSRSELAAVNQLQPQFQAMRDQLAKATEAINAQQKVLSSSEEFAKQIFSSHTSELFLLDQFVKSRSVVQAAPAAGGLTVVYLLLPSTPVAGTMQLQYNIFVQLPNTYFNIHNLVIFYWGDPAENLKQKPLSISYFPDTGDTDLIQSLTLREGRVYADDQPMPKMGQPDLDFKGNKWMPLMGRSSTSTPPE